MPSENEGNTEKLTAQAALLDFHSDRAVAHASFLVASIFGLVTWLAIIQQMIIDQTKPNTYLSLIPFLAFSYLGYWSLSRFTIYASIAQELQENLLTYGDFEKKKEEEEEEKWKFSSYVAETLRRTRQQLIVKWILERLRLRGQPLLFVPYLSLVIVLSYVVYFQSADVILQRYYVIAVVFLVLLVILPALYSMLACKKKTP